MSFSLPPGDSTTYPGNSIFENVYILDELFYDFTKGGTSNVVFNDVTISGDLEVVGLSTFKGPVTFESDVIFDIAKVGILTVTERSDIGIGGTLFRAIIGDTKHNPSDPDYLGSYAGRVGIGSTQPERLLDIGGDIKIDHHIWDSSNSIGQNGYYLNRDANGIRWIAASPVDPEGIFIQENGVYLPSTNLVGSAVTFGAINFTQINSSGLGTDNIVAIQDPDNPNFIARIQAKDYWGYTTGASAHIYRMSRVGINNNNPSFDLDVTGTGNITGNTLIGGTLGVT